MSIFSRKQADHRFAADNMSAYIDDRLTQREADRLERHLAQCETCPVDLATLRQTKSLLRRAAVLPLPRSFTLPASVQVQRVRYKRLNWSFAMLGSASAVVALLLVVLVAGDALFSYLGIPARTALYSSAPMVSGSAPAIETESIKAQSTNSTVEVTQLATESTAEPIVAATTQEDMAPPSEQPLPTEAPMGKIAAVPQASPNQDETGIANIESTLVDTVTPSAPKSLSAERNVAATANATTEDSSTTTVTPVPTSTQAATETPATPTVTPTEPATASAPLPTDSTAEEAIVVANAEGDLITPAPAVDAWSTQPLWQAWRGMRIAALVLVGVLCILLAGLLWTGYLRRH